MGSPSFDAFFDELTSKHRLQARTVEAMRVLLKALANGDSLAKAAERADVRQQTVMDWRGKYPEFKTKYGELISANERGRRAATEARREARLENAPKVGDRQREGRPGLADFRLEYFGRPTPIHQEAAVRALEDPSNLYVFILGPTGMGKDTLAGDYVAWEAAPDETGKRVAWFMESEGFSARRLERLSRYLTDPQAYKHAPSKTPGGKKPTRSLIDDFGPFKWQKGMRHEDGSKVERTQWDRLVKYFVRVHAPEQDPNLWATGIGGATYGSRIDVCVLSDAFTVENQKSPTVRHDGYTWVEGTLDTRLDESGRLVVIGTMLPVENNYERMIFEYTAGARVVSEESMGPAKYVKYSNGVAVVTVKAITVDAETGEEFSYWPERFPLDTEYRHKGKTYREQDLDVDRIREITEDGARLTRGLRWRRERSPTIFKALYMQERDTETVGDFTEATLERSKAPERTFGRIHPHELVVVGADPARTYGAGWVALAVDRAEQTVTVADFFFGDNLGITGIKSRLVLEPLVKWDPVWYCYEANVESAVLDDPLIKEAIRESGVSVATVHTGKNRNQPMVSSVGSIAAFMRTSQFRVPYQTAEDRARAEILFSHFRAWDSSPDRTKAGRSGHDPDDLAMAARAGWDKCLTLIEGKAKKSWGQNTGVPDHVRRKFDRFKKQARASKEEKVRRTNVPAEEVLAAFTGEQ